VCVSIVFVQQEIGHKNCKPKSIKNIVKSPPHILCILLPIFNIKKEASNEKSESDEDIKKMCVK